MALSKRITAWSYSRWNDWNTCPALAKYKHIEKLREPENEAMKRGSAVHEDLAAFLSGAAAVPDSGQQFGELLQQLRMLEPAHDQQWGFTSEWKPTGWFAKDTWFRSMLDACVVYDDDTADVVDFKTGKPSDTHAQQAELYAVSVLLRYPQVKHVTVRFWYLDAGSESVYRYARMDLAELQQKWEKRVLPMLSDEVFAPRPGRHCAYCAFAKSKGGECKFG